MRLLRDGNNKVIYDFFLKELKLSEMKTDNLNLVFCEFFKLIELRIMNIKEYFLKEDFYPIFIFLELIAHDVFSHSKIIFDKEQKKRNTQSNSDSLDTMKQQILKENEILINNKFNEFFDKFREKFGNSSSQPINNTINPASVSASTTSASILTSSTSTKSVKFSNYKDDYYIKNCFNKIKRYGNHIKLFNSHLENGSTPPSIFYNRFPIPLLADDEDFVNDYIDLIGDFQTQAMNLSKKYLYKRISQNEEKLKAKTDSLKENNDVKVVDSHVATLETSVSKD